MTDPTNSSPAISPDTIARQQALEGKSGVLHDTNYGAAFSLQGKGLNADKTISVFSSSRKPPSAMMKAIQDMHVQMGKMAQNAGIMYAGEGPTPGTPLSAPTIGDASYGRGGGMDTPS